MTYVQQTEKNITRQLYRYEGGLIYVDASNSNQQRLQAQGKYEPAKTDFLRKWLQPYMTFIDVGAQAGYFTMLAARWCYNGFVHAFEPFTDNYRHLVKAVELNSYEHVHVYPMAVSSSQGWREFFIAQEHGQSSLYKVKRDMIETSVMAVTLDEMIRKRPVHCLKIDAEGEEFSILQGATDLLKRERLCAVVMDLHPEYHNDCPHIGRFLQDLGYELYDPRTDMKKLGVVDYNLHELIALKR